METNPGVIVLSGYILYFLIKIISGRKIDLLLYITIGLHFVSMVIRVMKLQYFPIISIADTFVLLSFVLMLFYVFIKMEYLGLIPVLLSIIFLGLGIILYLVLGEVYVTEELKTILLPVHVIPAILGYGFLTIGFIGSIVYIFKVILYKQRIDKLDNFNFMSILIGNALFGFGALIMGSIWAYIAWGRFWAWDAKETFSLFTFLAYSVYLFLGFTKKIGKVKLSFICIGCYILLIFTYIGVPFLFSGMHSYE